MAKKQNPCQFYVGRDFLFQYLSFHCSDHFIYVTIRVYYDGFSLGRCHISKTLDVGLIFSFLDNKILNFIEHLIKCNRKMMKFILFCIGRNLNSLADIFLMRNIVYCFKMNVYNIVNILSHNIFYRFHLIIIIGLSLPGGEKMSQHQTKILAHKLNFRVI